MSLLADLFAAVSTSMGGTGWFVRGCLVLLAGLAVARGVPKLAAAARFQVLLAALSIFAVIPVVSVALPRLPIPVLNPEPNAAAVTERLGPVPPLPRPSSQIPVVEPEPRVEQQFHGPEANPGEGAQSVNSRALPLWAQVWLVGFGLVLVRFLVGRISISVMSRRSRAAGSEWREAGQIAATNIGLKREFRTVESKRFGMPMTWGVIEPVVLVPFAGRQWSREERVAVMAHELAHVARNDVLWQMWTRLVVALYWFNPLVWLVERALLSERERACDDLVLETGRKPSAYANQLLSLATQDDAGVYVPAAVAMARRSEMSHRLLRILAPEVNRRMSKRFLYLTWIVSLLLAVPIAVAEPVERAPAPDPAPAVDPVPTTAVEQPVDIAGDAPTAVPTQRPARPPRPPRSVSVSSSRDTTRYNARWSDGDRSVEVRGRGAVTLTDDERGIASIDRGGYLDIEEEDGRRYWRLRVESSGSGLEYDWRVDGERRDFDDDGAEWLADVMEILIYRLGFAAEERVARILAEDGADAVLDEIASIRSDFVKRRYFLALLDADLTRDEMQRGIRMMGEEIESDFEKASVLTQISERYLEDERLRGEYIRAAQNIDSDFEMRRVFSNVLEMDLSPEMIRDVVAAAQSIDSDFELATLLTTLAEHHQLGGEVEVLYLETVASIGSDFEKRRTLGALLENGGVSDENLDVLLRGAVSIDSDFEMSQLLLSVLTDRSLTDAQQAIVMDAIAEIDSDFERRRVLSQLLSQRELSHATRLEMLDRADDISSDFERASFLLDLSDDFLDDDGLREAYLRTASGIGSDFELRRVLGGLASTRGLSEAQLLDLLDAARSIDSDFELSSLLVQIAEHNPIEGAVEDAYRDLTDSISSDFEYGRAMRPLRQGRSRL